MTTKATNSPKAEQHLKRQSKVGGAREQPLVALVVFFLIQMPVGTSVQVIHRDASLSAAVTASARPSRPLLIRQRGGGAAARAATTLFVVAAAAS